MKTIKYLRLDEIPDCLREVVKDLSCLVDDLYNAGILYEIGYFAADGVEDPDYASFDKWLKVFIGCVDGEKICISRAKL